QARQRGHEDEAALERRRAGEALDLGEVAEKPEAAGPVHCRSGVVDAALQRVDQRAVAETPGDAAIHALSLRRSDVAFGDAEREGAGAEGDLGLARPPAAMAEECRLLVDEAGPDRQPAGGAEIPRRRPDLRQDLRRDPEEPTE